MHVESGKHVSVLFIVVIVCLLLLLVVFFMYISSLELGCGYKFALCIYMYVGSYGEFVFCVF